MAQVQQIMYDDCFPRSAILCKGVDEIDEILLDRPDWIPKLWPSKKYFGHELDEDIELRFTAVNSGNIAACAFLLSKMGKERFFLGWTTPSETTPLYHAAKCGDAALVSWILNNGGGISLETANNDGKTPLFAACNFCHLDVVRILILQGATAKDIPFFSGCSGSAFDYLNLNDVEELRVWIKKLMAKQDICDYFCDSTTVEHLKLAHTTILELYLEFSHDNDEDGMVDLSSLDHGDHEFLQDHPQHEALDSPDEIKDFAISEAKKIARAALFEQIDSIMHMLCYFD